MTDGAALPLALSDLVAEMVAGGLLVAARSPPATPSGGDLEAVSALAERLLVLARRALGAEPRRGRDGPR